MIEGKIYKIVCNISGQIYIGSTGTTLKQRLSAHKSLYKAYLNGKRNYTTSFAILENGDFIMVLLEELCCETKKQLFERERFHIENNICVNKVIPNRTHSQYREDNKEEIFKKKKIYNDLNRESRRKKRIIYTIENSEKISNYQKKYKELNKDKIQEQRRQYNAKRAKAKAELADESNHLA